MQRTDELVRLLREAEVEFMLIGGVAAAAWGSSYLTFDLDVLMPFDVENWTRALKALMPLSPRFHGHPGQIQLHDEPKIMSGFKMAMLETRLGRLDILREIPGGSYEQLSTRAVIVEVFGGPTRLIGLDDLIASKSALGREKDKPVVIELSAIRARMAGTP